MQLNYIRYNHVFHSFAGNQSKTAVNSSPGFQPKTFIGREYKLNRTQQASTSTAPWLQVDSDDAVATYTTGVLSTRVIPLCYILAMLIGIPSNAYIFVFLRLRAKSFPAVALYLNLALSDLLLLLSLALRVHYHFSGNSWAFGEPPCRLITTMFYGNMYCSAQTIACISLKRYLAVVKPFLYRRLATKTSVAAWTCLALWLLYGAAAVPELLVRQSYQIPRLGVTTCHDVLPLEGTLNHILMPYRLLMVCLGFVAPFLICVCAHVAVVRQLRRSGCDWRPFIRVSTVVFLIFAVCFSPSGVLHIAHHVRLFSDGGDSLYGYYRLTVCLCCFHSCLDPFLCTLMAKTAASELQFISLSGNYRRAAAML